MVGSKGEQSRLCVRFHQIRESLVVDENLQINRKTNVFISTSDIVEILLKNFLK